MVDPIVDIPTQYYTTFPDDTAEWTHAPLGDTTKLQLMQTALDRGSQVTPEEVNDVCIRLLGMPLTGALASVPAPPAPAAAAAPQPAAEGRREGAATP